MEKRFAIIGLPGSGKSTFALKLSQLMDLPVYHLDQYMFSGEKRYPQEEFLEVKKAILSAPSKLNIPMFYSSYCQTIKRLTVT